MSTAFTAWKSALCLMLTFPRIDSSSPHSPRIARCAKTSLGLSTHEHSRPRLLQHMRCKARTSIALRHGRHMRHSSQVMQVAGLAQEPRKQV